MRWEEHIALMGEMRNSYKTLAGKPEGKKPLRNTRHRLADIKMDLNEM